MSDVEQAEDEVIENPDPEADIAVEDDLLSDSDYESNIDHNDEIVACAEGVVAEDVIVRNYDGEGVDQLDQNVGVDNSWAESDQSNFTLQQVNHEQIGQTAYNSDNRDNQRNVGSVNNQENNVAFVQRNNEVSVNEPDDLAAEDEQCYRNEEINFVGAEWSLEPEENSHNYESYSDRVRTNDAFSRDDVESDQLERSVNCVSTDLTESQRHGQSNRDQINDYRACEGSDSVGNVRNSDLVEQQDTRDAERIGNPESSQENGPIEEFQPEAEAESVLELEKETTEADQELKANSRTNNQSINSVGICEPSVSHSSDNIERISQSSAGDLTRNSQAIGRQVPDDEVGSLVTCESVTMVTSESYQPECDQTTIKEQKKSSSPVSEFSEMAGPNQNVTSLQDNGERKNCGRKEESNTNSTKISENVTSVQNVNDRTELDQSSDSEVNNLNCVRRGEICDINVNTEPKSVFTSQKISLTSDKGAIPKQKQTNHSSSDSPVPRTNSHSDNKRSTSQSLSSHPKLASNQYDIEDAEDALLSELDATLQSELPTQSLQSNNIAVSVENCKVQELSHEQCSQNNEKCLISESNEENTSRIPELKDLRKQLNQAKNLLLERECQISRLKEDLEEKEECYNTVLLERDTYCKELECMKTQNSDDLYIPQIKELECDMKTHNLDDLMPNITELEYTIAQQQNEIRGWKDKLASHDGAAKRAIATLQNEMKLRLEQLTKTCDEANKEKDSMVVKYAQAEHKNLEFQKQAERAEAKVKEMEKERDVFLVKMKAVKEQRTKLGAEVENRIAEINSINKELDKQRELVSSADVRVKWAQNKLKAELEAHKDEMKSVLTPFKTKYYKMKRVFNDFIEDTKVQLEKMTGKLKEAKEETQQIRADCQAMIKTYQESEEVKSNSLDKELKLKETELLVNLQEKTNWELAHVKTQRELEVVKGELRDSKAQCANLTEKLSSLEGNLNQSSSTVDKYGEIIQKQKKEIQDLRERIETLVQYRTDFTRSQELIKTLDSEISELKISNKDLVAEMEACKKREMDKLELTEKLTEKNVELQSENTSLANKVFSLTGELQSIKIEYQGTDEKIRELTESLNTEQKLRKEETQTLNTKLAGKCKAVEDLTRKVEEEKDEIKTLKRKHTNNIRDLTRQLQQVRRKLETYEASTNGDKDTISMGSRTSSNGSLNINEQPNTQVVQPNHTPNQLTNSVPNHTPTEPEYPVITEQVEVDKQVLIERIVKLQRALARKNEKLEFMDDHIGQLVDEIQKKNKLIQSYILKEEAGTMTSDFSDKTKAEISRKHSIMGSVYSSHSNDGTMTLDLSLEINRKLQAVLEDTLLKNMTLKDSIDTLGQEIARLSQENRQLQLNLQGHGKTRGKGNPAFR